MNQSSVKERSRGSPHEKSAESSSFKQILRGVESLINEEEDSIVSNFEASKPSSFSHSLNPCLTNGQKLQQLMRSSQVRERITSMMRQNGYFDTFPILKVYIKRLNRKNRDFEMTDIDLTEAFSRFGHLEKVVTKPSGHYALFSDYHSAYFAEKATNDIPLPSIQAKLVVTWCQPSEYTQIIEYLNLQAKNHSPEPTKNASTGAKFTCRYEIQIENEKEFQVARKIIGTRGFNMKKIIDACLIEVGVDPKLENDMIKLRLRGKGSGYKEGPNKLESSQPLHLCISSKDESVYKKACRHVEELLKAIYKEYKSFCLKQAKKVDELSVRKLDCLDAPSSGNVLYNLIHHDQCLMDQSLTDSEIKAYIEARNRARRQLNFAQADRIRNLLKMRGIALIDEKGGRGKGVEVTTWRHIN